MTNLPPLPFVHSEYSIRNDPELKPYLEQVNNNKKKKNFFLSNNNNL